MIKAVFLDIDDTVLDFEAYVRLALREGFDRFGLPPYREEMLPVFTGVNNRLWQRIERGEMTREQLIDVRFQTVFQELGITGDARAFERYFRDAIWDCAIPVAGAAEMVPWLGARISSAPPAMALTISSVPGWRCPASCPGFAICLSARRSAGKSPPAPSLTRPSAA